MQANWLMTLDLPKELHKLGVITLSIAGASIPFEALEVLPNVSMTRIIGVILLILVISMLGLTRTFPRPTITTVLGIIFASWMSVTALWGISPELKQLQAITYISVSFFLIAGTLFVRTRSDLATVLLGYLFGSLIAALIIVQQAPTLLALEAAAVEATAFQQNRNLMAITLAVGVNFSIYLYSIYKWTRFNIVLSLILLLTVILLLAGIFLTGSRTALFALTVTTVPYTLFIMLRGRAQFFALCFVACLAYAFTIGTSETERLTARFDPQMVTHSAAYRTELYRSSVLAFVDSPVVGVGLSTVQAKYTGTLGQLGHATHNSFIGIAASSGLIGLLLFTSFLLTGMYYAFFTDPATRLLGTITPLCLLIFSITHNIDSTKVLWYAMIPHVLLTPSIAIKKLNPTLQ